MYRLYMYRPNKPMSIFLNDNKFDGDLEEIFPIFADQNINNSTRQKYNYTVLLLHNNNFYAKDISNLLQHWFQNASYFNWSNVPITLRTLTLFNNERIHGTFPDFNGDHTKIWSEYFLAHNTDISGSLPYNVHFVNKTLGALTLFS